MFLGALNQIYDDEVIGARGQIKGYGLDPDDYFGTGKDKTETGAGESKTNTRGMGNDPAGIR